MTMLKNVGQIEQKNIFKSMHGTYLKFNLSEFRIYRLMRAALAVAEYQ